MTTLQKAFAAQGANLIGLQESRVKRQGVRQLSSYFCFVSGATKAGQLGCELWVSKDCPIQVAGRDIYPKPTHFTVLHADPRRLIVSWQVLGAILDIVVFHAPTSEDLFDLQAQAGLCYTRRQTVTYEALSRARELQDLIQNGGGGRMALWRAAQDA